MNVKRHSVAALIAANIFLLLLACTNEKVIGPAVAAINSAKELLSPKNDEDARLARLELDDDGLMYVDVDAAGLLSDDTTNALRIGDDGLLFTQVLEGGEGGRGPEGPEGPEGPQGPEGPKGDPGTSVTILGSYDSANDLPTSGDLGDGYLVDGNLWTWTGSGWKNVGRIQGPAGERGPQGEQGQRGKEGPEGPKGDRGPEGSAGSKGEKGDRGPEGPQGPDGPMGPPGSGGGLGFRAEWGEIEQDGRATVSIPDIYLGDVHYWHCHVANDDLELIRWPCDSLYDAFDGGVTVSVNTDPDFYLDYGLRLVVVGEF